MTEAAVGANRHLTFQANLKETRYGWLRLTPAYSVHLVADLVEQSAANGTLVLDPFGGSGTTALVCAETGVSCVTADINPFLIWLTRAKTTRYTRGDLKSFSDAARQVDNAIKTSGDGAEWAPPLHQIDKWWEESTLHSLGRAMAAIQRLDGAVEIAVSDLLRVAFCRTLIERAKVSFGHQSMSFKKRKSAEALFDPEALEDLVSQSWVSATSSLSVSARTKIEVTPRAVIADARKLDQAFAQDRVGCVITSPPYPNRMSYVRELRPYMYWLGYLEDGRSAGELDWKAIGGTWGCATSNVGKWVPPEDREIPHPDFTSILARVAQRSDLLSRYIHKYFYDTIDHVAALKPCLAAGARIHYIVGNSKFYDTMLPVQEIYARIFQSHGLEQIDTEVIRKRSSKRELFEFVVSATNPRC